MADLNWSDAQWQKVNREVAEVFAKASVTQTGIIESTDDRFRFLPLYGPLGGSTETVRNELINDDDPSKPLRLNTDHNAVNRKLVNLTRKVELTSEQVAEDSLSNALLLFRRAAEILALAADQVVFKGYRRGFPEDDTKYIVNDPEPQKGLADLFARSAFDELTDRGGATVTERDKKATSKAIVSAVVKAIRDLEDRFHSAPFACVLGNELYSRVFDPAASLALPADTITPMLKGGPLLRSGKMDSNAGIVVSLAGRAVDIVVGTLPTVQFLQRMEDAKFLFRVYERFVLRIREAKPPVAGFRIQPDATQFKREAERLRALRG